MYLLTEIFNLFFAAPRELQRVAAYLLHLVPPPGRIFRPQHVCGRGGGELPPMSGRAGEGGAGAASGQESQKDRGEAEK